MAYRDREKRLAYRRAYYRRRMWDPQYRAYRRREAARWWKNDADKGRLINRRITESPRGRAFILVRSAARRALQKNLEFNLDAEWVESRLRRGCAITGQPFDLAVGRGRRGRLPDAPSLDRINGHKGYTKRNTHVVWCMINFMAGNWGWPAAKRALKRTGWKPPYQETT